MDIDRAKAISNVANSIIETAKVEVKYLEAIGGPGTGFMNNQPALKAPLVPRLVGKVVA